MTEKITFNRWGGSKEIASKSAIDRINRKQPFAKKKNLDESQTFIFDLSEILKIEKWTVWN